MKTRFWLAALFVACPFGPLSAADLTKIDRTIAKEPAYKSKSPRYCLLVFGPEARTRVWLVLDGDTLYVDRNGNGDLTEKDEKVTMPEFDKGVKAVGFMLGQRHIKAGLISVGGEERQELDLIQAKVNPAHKPTSNEEADMMRLLGTPPDGLMTGVILPKVGMALVDDSGVLQFAARPGDAPIIHFGGPLQIALQPLHKLERGQPGELKLWVGSPGLGKGTFATRSYEGVPEGAHPVADFEFPHREAGKPAIKLRVTLKERC